MFKILEFLSLIRDKVNCSAKEREYQHVVYGVFSFVGFISFYFFNTVVSPDTYESFIIRLIAAILAFLLIIKDFWPKFFRRFLPFFWNFTLLYNLPFFFTFMLLKNNWSSQWQMNELMALTILTILTDLITLSILAPLGICFACMFYYLDTNNPVFPDDMSGIITSYITVLIFCALFTFRKDMFFQERLKFHNQIQELNNSLEKKVKERTLELEDALASKTEFLNNMSHEIRTPLQGFTTLSEGLVEHWKNFTEEKKVSLASQVASNARRLASLVSNLLDLSKFNASKMIMDFRKMDLKDTIENIIEECNELYLSNKKIQITFEKCEQAIITGDQDRILQVLRNLFANAIKFVPDNGSIKVSLEKTELKGKEAFHFIIEDTGVGIPEDEIEAIFEPFTQSTTTKTKAGGTGLGLSICQQIIHAHHGKIWAENNKNGVGAKFHFILPILQVTDTLALIHNSALSVNKSDFEATILMIDDEEVCLASMELLIVNTSFSLIKAAGGAAGLAYLKAHYDIVDVVLLDLMMPDIYGLSILEEIRKDSNLAHIPVILQSGTSDKNEIEKAYAMGISSFISKPYEREVVISAIADALKSSSSL